MVYRVTGLGPGLPDYRVTGLGPSQTMDGKGRFTGLGGGEAAPEVPKVARAPWVPGARGPLGFPGPGPLGRSFGEVCWPRSHHYFAQGLREASKDKCWWIWQAFGTPI